MRQLRISDCGFRIGSSIRNHQFAIRNIPSVLPDRYVAHLERIARVSLPILHGARDYTAAAAFMAELQRALLHQYRIRLSYAKQGGQSEEYELDPYTLVFHKGGIYLSGYAHNRKGMRLFALERLRGVEVTRQRFEIPEGHLPEEHFSSAFGLVSDRPPMKVRVRFSKEIAHAVKDRLWRPDQKLKSDREGRVTIEFEASGEMELVSWILSYGAHAEVLDPPELRQEVKQQIRDMRQFYRSKDKK